MNRRPLIWTNPHTPVIGKKPKRPKQLFEQEREEQAEVDSAAAQEEYQNRQAEKRGIKP